MMWGTWLVWILVGGLVLVMLGRGGCCGHAGHGAGNNGGHAGHGGSEDDGKGSDPTRKPAGPGCH